jgi:hypothetical protein
MAITSFLPTEENIITVCLFMECSNARRLFPVLIKMCQRVRRLMIRFVFIYILFKNYSIS